jgi:hypothetical protein
MNVLFLDIDGVLNSKRWYNDRPYEPITGRLSEMAQSIDPEAVGRVNRIAEVTGCVIVLSSSWRCLDPIANIDRALQYRGLETHLYGATPSIGTPRGAEIEAWLAMCPTLDGWAILDDDSDMEPHMYELVQTDSRYGMLDEHAERVIRLLNTGEQ